MKLLVDTREQKWDHVRDGLSRLAVPFDRSKLYVGDYAWAHNQNVVVDRKAGLQEVYGNVIQQHQRFVDECKRAQESGIKLIVLVEQPEINELADVVHWRNPRRVKWYSVKAAQDHGRMLGYHISTRPPADSQTLHKIMRTIADEYGIVWEFCTPETTAQRIVSLLDPMIYGGTEWRK